MSTQSAFSLIELLVTLAFLGILAASVAGSASLRGDSELRLSVRSLEQLIRNEVLIASRLREERILVFHAAAGEVRDNSNKVRVKLPQFITIPSARFAGGLPKAEFRANGTVTPGSIEVRSSSARRCRVSVSLRGAVRTVCE